MNGRRKTTCTARQRKNLVFALLVTLTLFMCIVLTGNFEQDTVRLRLKAWYLDKVKNASIWSSQGDLNKQVDNLEIRDLRHKTFAWYVMTAKCIPVFLLSDFSLGNSSNLDIYVLSYKERCKDLSQNHIKYLFDNTSTWTSGRNQLWRYVQRSAKHYEYHIFIDDDVKLLFTNDILNHAKTVHQHEGTQAFATNFIGTNGAYHKLAIQSSANSAWRKFEETLLEYSPAFAVVNVCEYTGKQTRLMQASHWQKACGDRPMPSVTVTFFFDTIIIAYHRKAMDVLFPMYEEADKYTWWASASLQSELARKIFRGHGIAIWDISVYNTEHRPYPRGRAPDDTASNFYKGIDEKLLVSSDPHKNTIATWHSGIWEDGSVCGTPLKFPVFDHYRRSSSRHHD